MTINCHVCMRPEKCDCLCRTCVWARLQVQNPKVEISWQEFLKRWVTTSFDEMGNK